MQFKLKTLVAAVALVAAGAANAAFVNQTATGTGSLVFAAYDVNTGVGYLQNLTPQTYASFNSGTTNYSTSLASTFTSNFTNAADLRWFVFDHNVSNLITTASVVNDGGQEQVQQIGTINAALQTYMGDVIAAAGTSDSLLVSSSASLANPFNLTGTYAGNLFFTNAEVTGYSSAGFYKFGNYGPADNPSPLTQLAGTWSLASNGTLTYSVSAVPVPAAVWLFGTGLLGLAGVARRRKV